MLMCTDTCSAYANYPGYSASNGRCEDGGPGSETPLGTDCPLGSDCNDCGPRLPASVEPCSLSTAPGEYCTSTDSSFCTLSTTLSNCGTASVYYAA